MKYSKTIVLEYDTATSEAVIKSEDGKIVKSATLYETMPPSGVLYFMDSQGKPLSQISTNAFFYMLEVFIGAEEREREQQNLEQFEQILKNAQRYPEEE